VNPRRAIALGDESSPPSAGHFERVIDQGLHSFYKSHRVWQPGSWVALNPSMERQPGYCRVGPKTSLIVTATSS
jgi:hypothetical protein